MTAEEYHAKVKTFDRNRLEALIDRIPQNVNRSGKVYLERTAKIREDYERTYKKTNPKQTPQTT